MKLISILLWITFSCTNLFSQNATCAFDEVYNYAVDSIPGGKIYEQRFQENLAKYRAANTVPVYKNGVQSRSTSCPKRKYIVPVAVHIVHSAAHSTVGFGSNISEQQVLDQLDILNNAFMNAYGGSNAADADIYFCLAKQGNGQNAIFRYASNLYRLRLDEIIKLDSLKGKYPSTESYLNIYVVDSIISGSQNATIGGLASHPLSSKSLLQGIVMSRKFFGDASAAGNTYELNADARGFTLVHEAGHFLGLYHTFRNGCKGMDSSSCSKEGDLCCDTPPQEYENTTCTPVNSCNESPDKNDMIENYMNYTPDNCRNTFTRDQVSIMHFSLEEYRDGLINVDTINALNLSCCVKSAWFGVDKREICDSGYVTLQAIERIGYSCTYKWSIYLNNVLQNTNSINNNGFNALWLNQAGLYTIKLDVISGPGDTVSLTRNNYVQVKKCGPMIKSPNATWYCGWHICLEFHEHGTIATEKAQFVSPYPGITTQQTAISVSDSNGNALFYGGNDGAGTFNQQNQNVSLWYRDFSEQRDNKSLRSQNEQIKGSGNSLQNLIVPRPLHNGEFWWFTLYDGYTTGNYYFRRIALDDSGNYEITGPANLALKGPSGFPADANGAVSGNEAITAVSAWNDSFYWMYLVCPPTAGSAFASKLAIYKVLADTAIFFDTIGGINYAQNHTLKVSPDGRYLHCNYKVFEINRKTGNLTLKFDFTDKKTSNLSDFINRNNSTASEFSPNSRYLYITRHPRPDDPINKYYDSLIQLDLDQKKPYENRKLVSLSPVYYFIAQKTPDGRIAFLKHYQEELDVINYPDSLNTDITPNKCGFKEKDISPIVLGNSSMSVLGSMPDPVYSDFSKDIKKRISWYADSCFNYHFSHNIVWNDQCTWFFGDGSQSSGRNVKHSYNSGAYAVMCVMGADTLRTFIKVKQKHFTISGRSVTCDSNQLARYNTNPNDDFLTYNWGVYNGQNAYNAKNTEAAIQWYYAGYVNVEIADGIDGCIYSDTLFTTPQTPITNNIISGDTLFCDSFVNVQGSSPSGGNNTFNYSWFVKRNGIEYTLDSFTKSFTYPTQHLPFSNSLLYRNVVSNGCVNISNSLRLITKGSANKIIVIPNGCSDILIDVDSANRIPGSTYQWQYSADSLGWQTIAGQTSYSYTIIDKTWPKRYFRRIVNVPNCGYDTSSSIKIQGYFNIAVQPRDTLVCGNNKFAFYGEYQKISQLPSTMRWQYLNDSGWTNLFAFSGLIEDFASNFQDQTPFRFRLSNACVEVYSNTAVLQKAQSINFGIVNSDTTVTSAMPTTLRASWIGNRAAAYAVWQKSNYPESYEWDSIAKTEFDTILQTPVFNACNQRTYYRVLLRNLCPPNGVDFKSATKYSKVIEVGKYNNTNGPDLWIPDENGDWSNNGIEPNIADASHFTHSKWLWNRKIADSGIILTNNWVGRENILADTINLIHALIYNRGNSASSDEKVYFYWTINATNEDWPAAWTGLRKFVNKDNISAYYLDTFPRGGQINKVGIDLANFAQQQLGHPFLNPGDSVLITYRWKPSDTIPKPEWYYAGVNTAPVYSNTIGLCLLARIEGCNSSSYGMTYPEKRNTSTNNSTNTGNIKYNVLHNNNIVTANYYVSYIRPPFTNYVQNWTIVESTMKDGGGGGKDHPDRSMRLDFCVNDPIYYNNGEVLVTFPDEFWTIFNAANMPGNGFVYSGGNTIVINQPCASIGPFTVTDSMSSFLGFTWRFNDTIGLTGLPMDVLFTLQEFLDDTLNGSTQYVIQTVVDQNGVQNQGGNNGPPGAAYNPRHQE